MQNIYFTKPKASPHLASCPIIIILVSEKLTVPNSLALYNRLGVGLY